MGIATEHAPAPSGGMKPYTLWEIDVRLVNDAMVEVGKVTLRQDLWVGEGQFAVRLTPLGKNNSSPYEDRGSIDGHGAINGVSGFGGRLEGRFLPNNRVFLEGKGGAADFIMVATPTGPDHYRCFRKLEFKQPMNFWGIAEVRPGTYFFTSEDQVLQSADQPPAEMKVPLVR
jgi:hypothetical protein